MEYQEKLRTYIEAVFQDPPDSEELRGTRDELSADLLDRYAQALSDGEAPERAYQTALNSLGNLSELVEALGGQAQLTPREGEPAPHPPAPPEHGPGHPR